MDLAQHLTSLRRLFTGESHRQARPIIAIGLAKLSRPARSELIDHLNGRPDPNWLASPRGRAVQNALMGDATTKAQLELESEIFEATTEAIDQLHIRPPLSLLRPARVIRAVSRASWFSAEVPTLHLHDYALPALLCRLLPCTIGTEVYGAPGLRMRRHAHSLELFFVDTPAARVYIAGVTHIALRAAVAFIEHEHTDDLRETMPWRDSPHGLTDIEREFMQEYGRGMTPAVFASAMLRRPTLTGQALWTQNWSTGQHLNVVWPDGPAPIEVAQWARHPIFGIPCAVRLQQREPTDVVLVDPSEQVGRWRSYVDSELRLRQERGPRHGGHHDIVLQLNWDSPGVDGT